MLMALFYVSYVSWEWQSTSEAENKADAQVPKAAVHLMPTSLVSIKASAEVNMFTSFALYS